jgi:hypothetical protein
LSRAFSLFHSATECGNGMEALTDRIANIPLSVDFVSSLLLLLLLFRYSSSRYVATLRSWYQPRTLATRQAFCFLLPNYSLRLVGSFRARSANVTRHFSTLLVLPIRFRVCQSLPEY